MARVPHNKYRTPNPDAVLKRSTHNGCPIVLAIRIGDYRAIVDAKARIVASMEPERNPYQSRRKRGAE